MKKKINAFAIVSILLYMLVGGVCGYLAAINSGSLPFPLLLGWVMVCVYVAAGLQTVIHEGGHLIFGLLTGYRFCSFRIFSLMLLRQDGKLVIRKMHLAGTAGQCLLEPPELVDGKMPVILYNMGGAIMNLLASLLLFGLYLRFGGIFLPMCAMMGLVMAAQNGIPMQTGMVDNDGRNALSLGKNPAALRGFWLQLKMNALLSRGTRLKEMPPDWFRAEQPDNPMTASIAVLSCNRLMEEHDFAQADARMAELLSGSNGVLGLHRNMLLCDRMYCELIGENRQAVLERMRSKEQLRFMKMMKKFPSVLRTEYAYALLGKQDLQQAEAYRKTFEKIARSYPYPCDIQTERELMAVADNIWKEKQHDN